MERNRRPPGVEEALSSMLWTPYERTPTDSSEDEISSPCKTIRSKCNTNVNVSYSYTTTDRHLYPEPIRYNFPGYVPFMPKTFSGQSQAQEQLPSYENIENERHHRSLNTIASTGIYFIPPFPGYGSSMVNSFTDDFLQYQVRKSTYNNPTTTTTRQIHSSITASPTTITSNNNRFSSDFSSLNLNLPSSHCGSTNVMQTITTRHGDLHFSKQSNDDQVCHYNHENIDDNVRGTSTTATTQTTTNTKYVADLPDEFRVSKPLTHQSECINRSRDRTQQQPDGSHHTNQNFYTQSSHIQIVNASTSTAHVLFDLDSSESSKCVQNNEGTVMRLNVPAAVPEGGNNQTMFVSGRDSLTTIGCSDSSRILENGTLMGTIVPQPSLTIHVNQGDHNSQPQQDVVNQQSGISIVNCYRAVPVQIVNKSSGGGGGVVNNLNAKCDNQKINNDQIQVLNEVKCEMDTRNLQQRTFTSTEAQTDDLQESGTDTVTHPVQIHSNPIQSQTDISFTREQRRRDRRERRHNRNSRQQHIHPAPPSSLRPTFEILPDILNSHVPPPYTALTLAAVPPSQPQAVLVPPIITPLPVGPPEDGRYTFPLPIMRRSPSERSGKGCCGQWFAGPPLRAVIFVVALGGLACALGGAALGATGLAGPPTSHFTAALLMTDISDVTSSVTSPALEEGEIRDDEMEELEEGEIRDDEMDELEDGDIVPPERINDIDINKPLRVGFYAELRPRFNKKWVLLKDEDGNLYRVNQHRVLKRVSLNAPHMCGGKPNDYLLRADTYLRYTIIKEMIKKGKINFAGYCSKYERCWNDTGVGMILVTVSGAAWRMTAPGAPQCLGLGSSGDLGRCGRRPCSGRAPHGLLYPEFQHRPPPPSYQASMQEYRLRLLLLDRDRQSGAVRGASPPPTYRSHAGSLLRVPLTARNNTGGPGSEYSLPPSYRAQHQTNNSRPSPQTISGANIIRASDTAGDDSLNNSCNHDLFNNISTDSAVAVSQQLQIHQQQSENHRHQRLQQNSITTDSLPDTINHHNVLVDVVNNTKISQICNNENSSLTTTNNAVDRLHRKMIGTNDSSGNGIKGEDCARKDLVTIVTISGCTESETTAGEMDILAHL